MFGADDEDWAIYRKIVHYPSPVFLAVSLLYRVQNTAAESDEEDDLCQLQSVEQKLLTYDPTFTHQHTHGSITTQRSALISAFRPLYEEGDVEGEFTLFCFLDFFRLSTVAQVTREFISM